MITYVGVRFYLADLAKDRDALAGYAFENCEIMGPAIIRMLIGTARNCKFASPDAESLFVVVPEDRMAQGVINLLACTFKDCTFYRVGIAGSQEQIDEWKKGFKVSIAAPSWWEFMK